MDINQMLPMLLNGKLGEREKMLLKLTQNPDQATMGKLMTELAKTSQTPRVDTYGVLKKIIPAETLGRIIKYFQKLKQT